MFCFVFSQNNCLISPHALPAAWPACLPVSVKNRLEAVAEDKDPREEQQSRGEKEEGEEKGSGGGSGSGSGVGGTVALAAALLRGSEVAGGSCDSSDGRGEDGRDGDDEVLPLTLPPNLYDVDRILEKTPLLRNNNAFHDTLNS